MPERPVYVGIDVGTSGVRALAIDEAGTVQAQAVEPMPAPGETNGAVTQDPGIWWAAVQAVIRRLPGERIAAIAIDGTSGTLLLTAPAGRPLTLGYMYNDASAAHLAPMIRHAAPPESGAHGATSPLARLLMLQPAYPGACHALHQADWIAGRLLGRYGLSDENNALKLGYDPVSRHWPDWLDGLGVRRDLLPEVRQPGTPFGTIDRAAAHELNLPATCRVVAGTTDGCASFLATGASEIGDGVTALGSTLTIKLLSDRPIFAPRYGVYSHRLGDRWLAGGASNSGGKALLRFFTAEQMADLTPRLQTGRSTGLKWHPLPSTGERFPVADPAMTFEPQPMPDDPPTVFQALLEGIADVEAEAYGLLTELGGPALQTLRTVGGGAGNTGWTEIRRRRLSVPMLPPAHLEAAYGTALLARDGAHG